MDYAVDMPVGESLIADGGEPVDSFLDEILQCASDNIESEPEDEDHNNQEGRDGGPLACEHTVDGAAACMLFALPGLYDRVGAGFEDEAVAHVGNGGSRVEAPLVLHLLADVIDHGFLIVFQLEPFHHQ
ncbi:unknown [Prevotella sp. CAG:924]|nr:unknown [Prevotella sp. CAG:924]